MSKQLSENKKDSNQPLPVIKTSTEDEVQQLKEKIVQLELALAEEKRKAKISSSTIPPLSQSPHTTMPAPKSTFTIDQKQVEKLLQYVTEGEQDQAEEMLKKDKNLLLSAGTVTDLSGREFKQITAFQYALWAMDWHMWTMIQQYLSKEVQAEQFDALESKGTAHGKHFSFQPLIDAFQTYINKAKKVWNYDSQAENHWQKMVGGEQRLLPIYVINEYCRPGRSFYPCPKFKEATLPRTRLIDEGEWFTAKFNGGLLGESFAWVLGTARGQPIRHKGGHSNFFARLNFLSAVACDLIAIQSLSKARTQQLELLSFQLSSATSHTQTFGAS